VFRRAILLTLVLGVFTLEIACGSGNSASEDDTLRIISGSENQTLEPILEKFADDNHAKIPLTYKGSVDIMLALRQGAPDYDAVWPANSLWVSIGDTNHVVKSSQSIMTSPVVLGIKRSIADGLGWVGKDVTVEDIVTAAKSQHLRLMMTSASQSNSGASAYFGFLHAFSGTSDAVTSDNLHDPNVQEKVKEILGLINRSAQSSGFLKDLFLQRYNDFDGMFNYESLLIEANTGSTDANGDHVKGLLDNGQEALFAIYPKDGLAIADSPLGFVDHGNARKAQLFEKLQQYLLSDDVQKQLLSRGRRIGLAGTLNQTNVDTSVFNKDWGIDLSRTIVPIRFPAPAVIQEAIDLYQTGFRKGSFTAYCLDFSGSMIGDGEAQLKRAMATLLDQDQAKNYLLQASPDDITAVLTFNDKVINATDIPGWTVRGNASVDMTSLLRRIEQQQAGGGTAIYSCAAQALRTMKGTGIDNRFPAVILMTDGMSNVGSLDELTSAVRETGLSDVPVYAITFGEASFDQLNTIAAQTGAKVFDGKTDLVGAFRQAKGNN